MPEEKVRHLIIQKQKDTATPDYLQTCDSDDDEHDKDEAYEPNTTGNVYEFSLSEVAYYYYYYY